MKIKHISMIVLLWMMTIQATAQQVKWMNPMDGDEPYICGRAWNKEMGKSYDRLPERFAATLPKNVWSLKAQTAGVIVRFVSNSKTIRVRYGCPSNNYNGFNMTGINKSGVDLYGKTPDGDTHWIANHMSWKMKADTASMSWQNLTFKNKSRGVEYTLYLPNYNGVKWLPVHPPVARAPHRHLRLVHHPGCLSLASRYGDYQYRGARDGISRHQSGLLRLCPHGACRLRHAQRDQRPCLRR